MLWKALLVIGLSLGWALLGFHVVITHDGWDWFYEVSYDPLAATILGGIPAGITVGVVNYFWMKRLSDNQHCPKCCPVGAHQ